MMPRQRTTNANLATTNNVSSGRTSRVQSRSTRDRVRSYSPTMVADRTTSGVGLLEAEYFIIVFLLILELFVGSGDYASKMVSTMKRGTLVTILFFFLAIISGIGPNASKLSKGLGGLVVIGILLSSPGANLITALDNFAKADWVGSSGASADTGTQQSTGGAVSSAEQKANQAASNAANTITEIQLPGIGPVFALQKVADALKGLLHL